jgi:hypothetical protein
MKNQQTNSREASLNALAYTYTYVRTTSAWSYGLIWYVRILDGCVREREKTNKEAIAIAVAAAQPLDRLDTLNLE